MKEGRITPVLEGGCYIIFSSALHPSVLNNPAQNPYQRYKNKSAHLQIGYFFGNQTGEFFSGSGEEAILNNFKSYTLVLKKDVIS